MASVGPMVVWTGLLLNIWVLYILWLGGILPLVLEIGLPAVIDQDIAFFHIRKLTFGATQHQYLYALLLSLLMFAFSILIKK